MAHRGSTRMVLRSHVRYDPGYKCKTSTRCAGVTDEPSKIKVTETTQTSARKTKTTTVTAKSKARCPKSAKTKDLAKSPTCSVKFTLTHEFMSPYKSEDGLCLRSTDHVAVLGGKRTKRRVPRECFAGIYNEAGKCLTSLKLPKGCDIRSITRHRDLLLVGDYKDNHIWMFNSKGKMVKELELGQYNPWRISANDEDVWIVDLWTEKVHKVRLNSDQLEFDDEQDIVEVKLQNKPTNIYSIAVNRFRLAIAVAGKVHVYSQQGGLWCTYGGVNGYDIANPTDICLDENNMLYITDYDNDRIIIVDDDGNLVDYIYTSREPSDTSDAPDSIDVYNNTLCVVNRGRESKCKGKIQFYKLDWSFE